MAVICPTITADSPEKFKEQMDRVLPFATRLHFDYSDGEFSPFKLLDFKDTPWPSNVTADLHLMFKDPTPYLENILELKPNMVIIHAESDGNFFEMANVFKALGIKVGLSVLQHTEIEKITQVMPILDHLLIFSGDLGKFGGKVDASLFHKIVEAKKINPNIEIGWDGGINDDNTVNLLDEGVDVLNVGGFIHSSSDPQNAYATLELLVENAKK